jgi:hypothetical protein
VPTAQHRVPSTPGEATTRTSWRASPPTARTVITRRGRERGLGEAPDPPWRVFRGQHGRSRGPVHPYLLQGTAAVHQPMAAALLPQAQRVCDAATARKTTRGVVIFLMLLSSGATTD